MIFKPYVRALFYAGLLSGIAGCFFSAQAQIRLGEPFGDHMVLPRDVPVTIWGTGCPGGETVRISLAGQSISARAGWAGDWEVRLAPMNAGGPYQMLIQIGGSGRLIPSSSANDHGGAEINDVLIGELYLMQTTGLRLSASKSPLPIASTHPYAEVRVFRSGHPVEAAYSSHSTMQWFYAAQDRLPPDTAVLFAAGRSLHDSLHLPVGIVVNTNAPYLFPCKATHATGKRALNRIRYNRSISHRRRSTRVPCRSTAAKSPMCSSIRDCTLPHVNSN